MSCRSKRVDLVNSWRWDVFHTFGWSLQLSQVTHSFCHLLILEWVIEAITTSLFSDDIRIVCLWITATFHPSVWPPRVILYQFTTGLAQSSCLHVNELEIIQGSFVIHTTWCMLCSFSINYFLLCSFEVFCTVKVPIDE